MENLKRVSPNTQKYVEVCSRKHLLPEEVEAMRQALKKAGRYHAHQDATLILLIYRHGFRVSEVAGLRWEQIDSSSRTIYVKRVKQETPSTQPIYGDEIRALRKLQRDYRGTDTRTIQAYLGHKYIGRIIYTPAPVMTGLLDSSL